MKSAEDFFKSPSAQEFLRILNELLLNAQLPADQIILDDVAFCKRMSVSKRHAADLRAERKITFSKPGGKVYYILSDILDYIERYKVPAIHESSRLLKSKKPKK